MHFYLRNIQSLKLYNIVIWVDRNYADRDGYIPPVENVEKLFSIEFDYVFIAIEFSNIANDVKNMLISGGIPDEKIVLISDI